ncbi:MAG TPA: LuxR C-terminal-related transcriptional regulator [Streptosporangiaceae bacterium]|nr:LuxR C-terminal-related transcriptional regulator [Streptosporangiaceae bacterium]
MRFWAGFIEALRAVAGEFGTDAAELLAMDQVMSADVIASIANDAAGLLAGTAIVVDDFHYAAAAAAKHMTDLVEHWPYGTVQLVLASRFDPPVRQHRLRISGQLCELRDEDLYFSVAESAGLLANFGVTMPAAQLEQLHQASEGWPAAVQMAALSLRGTADPGHVTRALEARSHTIADYFTSEVLDTQPADLVQFMLDTSILGQLTPAAAAAVTGRHDAAAMLRRIDAAHLFLIALDDYQETFRYHRLVRQILHAELRARDRDREPLLHQRAAEYFEQTGDTPRATRHFLAAHQISRALDLMQDRVITDFLQNPAPPGTLDLTHLPPTSLTNSPDQLLTIAADLLLRGDITRGGEYLDALAETTTLEPRLAARLATLQCFYYGLNGQLAAAEGAAGRARAVQEQAQPADEWDAAVPLIMMRLYASLEDVKAVEREVDAALASPALTEPAKLVLLPGAQALAWFEAGHLADAGAAARAAADDARRLGFEQHFFAVDHLRALAGLALERRDLDTAEHLTEQALSISEHQRPIFEFLALLDRATIWAARGQISQALATVGSARAVLTGTRSPLRARADEAEALLRLSLGDQRTPADLTTRLPAARRTILLARIALAAGDHHAAREHLQSPVLGGVTPRRTLVRELLLAATAIERGDPMTPSILGSVLHAARGEGFLNTVVTAAPQVTSYLIEHAAGLQADPFVDQVTAAARQARAAQPRAFQPGRVLAEPLTAAEQRILELLPGSTYLQMADILFISRNTVKTHLRSIYHKLGATSRSQAIERALELRLL